MNRYISDMNLREIVFIALLGFTFLVGSVFLGIIIPLKQRYESVPEYFSDVDIPHEWRRIESTNFITNSAGDTLEIVLTIRKSYHYRNLTREQKEALKVSISK